MKKSLVTTLLVLSSANTFAGVAEYFSEKNVCGRKVKREIGKFEKKNPGKLAQLSDYKVELERMNQMQQLRDRAIERAKSIETENRDNMTVKSFFASDKPLKERMKDRTKDTHIIEGVAINEIIDSSRVNVEFNPTENSMWEDKNKTQVLESRAMTWYDHKNSTKDKLILNIDFGAAEENCRYEDVSDHAKIYATREEAIAAYEEDVAGLQKRIADGVTEYDDREYSFEVEGFSYKNIEGKAHRRECDHHPLAIKGRVRVIVTENQDGTFNYETEIGETDLVNRLSDVYDENLAKRSEHLAEIGFVERLSGIPEKYESDFYQNGRPSETIKNEGALEAWVNVAEAKYTEYFERNIGKECYDSYLAGDIYVPWARKETLDDREKYGVVQNLNRGIASVENNKQDQDLVTKSGVQGGAQTAQGAN